jgi:hypothetical protein
MLMAMLARQGRSNFARGEGSRGGSGSGSGSYASKYLGFEKKRASFPSPEERKSNDGESSGTGSREESTHDGGSSRDIELVAQGLFSLSKATPDASPDLSPLSGQKTLRRAPSWWEEETADSTALAEKQTDARKGSDPSSSSHAS